MINATSVTSIYPMYTFDVERIFYQLLYRNVSRVQGKSDVRMETMRHVTKSSH